MEKDSEVLLAITTLLERFDILDDRIQKVNIGINAFKKEFEALKEDLQGDFKVTQAIISVEIGKQELKYEQRFRKLEKKLKDLEKISNA